MQMTTKEEYQIIANHLEPLLKLVDKDIISVDYLSNDRFFPSDKQNQYHKDLFAIEYKDKIRYINVTNLDPFKVLNTVVCTIDHYNLNYLFMTEKETLDAFGVSEVDLEME